MGHHVRIALLPFPCFLMAQVKNGGNKGILIQAIRAD